LVSTTAVIVSSIVGTDIFSVPSSLITSTGRVEAALLQWVLGFVLAFCRLFVWLKWEVHPYNPVVQTVLIPNVVSTTALIVSTMVGTGIFSVPSSIIASTGSVGPDGADSKCHPFVNSWIPSGPSKRRIVSPAMGSRFCASILRTISVIRGECIRTTLPFKRC
jgi:hypothetical protein